MLTTISIFHNFVLLQYFIIIQNFWKISPVLIWLLYIWKWVKIAHLLIKRYLMISLFFQRTIPNQCPKFSKNCVLDFKIHSCKSNQSSCEVVSVSPHKKKVHLSYFFLKLHTIHTIHFLCLLMVPYCDAKFSNYYSSTNF